MTVEIKTNTLGQIEIDENRVITMTELIPGVESGGLRYALIDVNPESPVKLLQSIDNQHVCFLVGDPSMLVSDYVVTLDPDELGDLDIKTEDEAAVMVVLNILIGGQGVTANLKAPILINRRTFKGRQVMLKKTAYGTKEPVSVEKQS